MIRMLHLTAEVAAAMNEVVTDSEAGNRWQFRAERETAAYGVGKVSMSAKRNFEEALASGSFVSAVAGQQMLTPILSSCLQMGTALARGPERSAMAISE
jgi:hypothetical protein